MPLCSDACLPLLPSNAGFLQCTNNPVEWTKIARLMSCPISKDGRAQQHKSLTPRHHCILGITAAVRVCKGIGYAAMPKGNSVLSAHQENIDTPSVASMSVEQVHIGALKLAHGVLQQ